MTSEGSDEGSAVGTAHGRSAPREGSLTSRAYAWLSSNGLYVETGLSVVAIAAGIASLPFVTFGAFTAIGGETSILTAGLVLAVVSVGLLLALATLLLVHGYVESRHRGLPSSKGGGNTAPLVHRAARLVESLVSGAFVVSLTAVPASVLSIGTVPSAVLFAVASTGLLLPAVVLLHAVGAAGLSVFASI